MKTNTKQILIAIMLFVSLFMIYSCTTAQTLKVKGKLLIEGESTLEKFDIEVIDILGNTMVKKTVVNAMSVDLKYNAEYAIIISRPGCQAKSIYVNTFCNESNSVKYICTIDLKTRGVEMKDMPIQAGGIFYNKYKNEFDYFLQKCSQ